MKYKVKTRNFNGKQAVCCLLNIVASLTKTSIYRSENFDNKYYLETDNPIKAWTAWIFFSLLKPFSGGWTYILIGNAYPGPDYKSIYTEAM